MRSFDWTASWPRRVHATCGVPLTARRLAIYEFLESHGKRFCVDYGYQNYLQVAQVLWNDLKHENGLP